MCNSAKELFDRVRSLGINIEQAMFRIEKLRETAEADRKEKTNPLYHVKMLAFPGLLAAI